jgi:long-chain fatty acid transport protein
LRVIIWLYALLFLRFSIILAYKLQPKTYYRMKKLLLIIAVSWMAAGLAMAGGIVTNTNQSASWVRNPARDATRSIDAVFYNPAGLFKLKDGFHLSINNQYITQQQKVENFYAPLNQSLYKGTVTAPLFPGIYGVYKMDKFAISFGINPIGGGGGAEYKNGLPSFELNPSDMVSTLAGAGATSYQLDQYFKGSSVYMGYQLGISYKLSDMIQVFAGARYVTVKNVTQGHLKSVQVKVGANWVNVNDVFTGLATQANGAAVGLHPLIAGGLGGLTPAQAQAGGFITPVQAATIVGGLTAMGVPNADLLTIAQDSLAYIGASGKFTSSSALTGLLFNQEADVTQTGSGITPILGVNLSLTEKLNIGIKYEFATKMDIKNKTTKDVTVGFTGTGIPITMFPDGAITHNDMPAYLSIGAEYAATNNLTVSLGGHYYFDRSVSYGKSLLGAEVDNKAVIDKNFYELAAGLEYKLSRKFLVSAGYLMTKTGVNPQNYNTDMNYSLSTSTIGIGGQFAFTDNIKLNFGYAYTAYTKGDNTISHTNAGTGVVIPAIKQTYWKNTQIFSLGLDLSF